MTKLYKPLRFLAYFIEVLVIYVLQQTPHALPRVFGQLPNILILVVVSISMFEGEKTGLIYGFSAGFLTDLTMYGHIGFFSVVLAVVGFLAGFLPSKCTYVSFSQAMLSSIVAVCLVYVLHFLWDYVRLWYDDILFVFGRHFVPRIGYTLLFAVLIYFLNKAIFVNLKSSKR